MYTLFVYQNPKWHQRLYIRARSEIGAYAKLQLYLSNNPRYGDAWTLVSENTEMAEDIWSVGPNY